MEMDALFFFFSPARFQHCCPNTIQNIWTLPDASACGCMTGNAKWFWPKHKNVEQNRESSVGWPPLILCHCSLGVDREWPVPVEVLVDYFGKVTQSSGANLSKGIDELEARLATAKSSEPTQISNPTIFISTMTSFLPCCNCSLHVVLGGWGATFPCSTLAILRQTRKKI